MKTLTLAALVAALMLLLPGVGYAVPAAAPASDSSAMVLAMDEPAVSPSITPGAGPETSSEPIHRAKPVARMETTTPNTGITTTAARQAMPGGQSVNAAYAPPEKHAESAAPSFEELNKRIEALSKEISALREDLGKLKAQHSGMK